MPFEENPTMYSSKAFALLGPPDSDHSGDRSVLHLPDVRVLDSNEGSPIAIGAACKAPGIIRVKASALQNWFNEIIRNIRR